MFSSEQWLANSGADFYNGVATQSLRFDDGSSAYLSRTPSSASNLKTWTWSSWYKRSSILNNENLFLSSVDSNNWTEIYIRGSDQVAFRHYSNAIIFEGVTTALQRDVSAFYHITVSVDTTQGTASDRFNIYINGINQNIAFNGGTYPTQNLDLDVNRASSHTIGERFSSEYLDGYLSEVNFIDGLALTPTSFGEFKNGVWIPIDTSGLTFGTNGFRLKFDQVGVGTASTSTIGADTSGNTNHWTSSGIVASDCAMPDSPENNFCTWNPLDNVDLVLAEGSLKTTGAGNSFDTVRSTFAMSSGSWYAEFLSHAGIGNGNNNVGITTQSEALSGISGSNFLGSSATSYGYSDNDNVYNNGSVTNSTGTTYVAGDIIGVTFTGSEIKWYKNNSLIATVSSIADNDYCFTTTSYSTSMGMFANFGQDSSFAGAKTAQGNTDGNGIGDFYYAPPSGFLALCTANLPEPTIGANSDTQADDHFNTALFTSDVVNPSGSQAPVVVGFKPDFIWTKNRNNVETHYLADSNRGLGSSSLFLRSNTAAADFDTDTEFHPTDTGFNIVDSNTASGEIYFNNGNAGTPRTYVAWNWKANGGTTSSNTSGSITSTVQANTDAGFSIVTYTGNSTAGATVGHGLSFEPNVMLVKCRSDSSSDDHWFVYHSGIASDPQNWEIYLNLNLQAYQNNSYPWNSTAPTSSVFTLGSTPYVNETAETYVAYCFHSVEGYSKIGSYTGNGNADGTFVYTGFRPAWVMLKRTDTTGDWRIYDNLRQDPYNPQTNDLLANDNQGDSAPPWLSDIDFVSNGFKIRSSNTRTNTSGGTYIYMAFADSVGAFKYANAR